MCHLSCVNADYLHESRDLTKDQARRLGGEFDQTNTLAARTNNDFKQKTPMKKIEATIHPMKVNQVQAALAQAGFAGMRITDVKGLGSEPERSGICRGHEYPVTVADEVGIELLVPDERTDEAIAVIVSAAQSLNLSVSAATEAGSAAGPSGIYRGQRYQLRSGAEHEIEMVVDESRVDRAVAAVIMEGDTVRLVFGDEKELASEKPRAGTFRGQHYYVRARSGRAK